MTQPSGRTADKQEKKKSNFFTVYVSGYIEPDPNGQLSPNISRLFGPTK
jgi:hypothetical protein